MLCWWCPPEDEVGGGEREVMGVFRSRHWEHNLSVLGEGGCRANNSSALGFYLIRLCLVGLLALVDKAFRSSLHLWVL